jgi:8-oxo-dGTP pyrophosphatase MutT (NUDIX family)
MQQFNFTMAGWANVSEETVLETPIFQVNRRHAQHEVEGLESDFYIVEAPAWANVIATTAQGELVLVEQFRHGIEQSTLEIPGGVVDEGESPRESVERELLEETGYQGEEWHYLGAVSSNPAFFNNYTELYWAEGCELVEQPNLDTHEFIETHLVPLNQFFYYIQQGDIHHSLVVAAAAKFMLYRSEVKL